MSYLAELVIKFASDCHLKLKLLIFVQFSEKKRNVTNYKMVKIGRKIHIF